MKNDNIVDLLKTQDWGSLIRRLTHYAIWRMGFYTWHSGSVDRFPEGKTPEDLVCGAIEKVWSGTRDWDPEKYPDLFTHLKWIVKSDIDHLFSSQEHQLDAGVLRNEDDSHIENGRKGTIRESSTIDASIDTKTAEEDLIAREEEEFEKKLKAKLFEMVKGDEDLELLLVFFEDGIDKPETIAEEMGWEITRVYNLKRKLFRKASKLLDASRLHD